MAFFAAVFYLIYLSGWKAGGIYDSISYIDGIFEYRTDGTDEQNILHVMDNRSRIASIRIGDSFGDSTPVIQYNLEDLLGNSFVLLKDNSADINKQEYYPFGETSFGSYALKRYCYVGKERDGESGLYYYGARYYSAWMCRFVSTDPLANSYPFYGPYDYAGNRPVSKIDIDGMQPGNALINSEFRVGVQPRPKFSYDKGFLDAIPSLGYEAHPRSPGFVDYAKYSWWGLKLNGSMALRWDLGNANRAYEHFRNGKGKDYFFDLPDYFDEDASGKITLETVKNIAKASAAKFLTTSGIIKMTSVGFSAGSLTDARFPYPATEDWQKAIGAFNFWVIADVSAIDKDGVVSYTMKLTVYAEDKYNFNPGQQDIATGIPDSDNGNFELTGLAQEFMQHGAYTETIKWQETSKNTQAPNSTGKVLLSAPTNNLGN